MPKYYEFEVSLKFIKPRIWRRFLLHQAATFAELHNTIQDAFGWQQCHLWEFREPGRHGEPIGGVPMDDGWGPETPDAKRIKLSHFFVEDLPGTTCIYAYDFGDDWEHQVKMRKVVADKGKFNRRLLAGRRACPREDCGGAPGYERMVEFVRTGDDIWGDDAVDLARWLGDWDPERFELKAAKKTFDR